jgi:hypothetical protein
MLMRKSVLGVVLAALALPGCSESPPSQPSGPVASVATSEPETSATSGLGGAPAPSGFLDGKRQVFFLPRLDETELPDSVLAVTNGGRVQVTDGYTERALFVPVPKARGAKERLIKTGKLRTGGEPLCLQVHANGADPLTLITAPCDAGDPTQLFLFEPSGEDEEGRTTYGVRNRDAYLQWHALGATGLVVEELGDSELDTTFSLQDQGAATLPKAG